MFSSFQTVDKCLFKTRKTGAPAVKSLEIFRLTTKTVLSLERERSRKKKNSRSRDRTVLRRDFVCIIDQEEEIVTGSTLLGHCGCVILMLWLSMIPP